MVGRSPPSDEEERHLNEKHAEGIQQGTFSDKSETAPGTWHEVMTLSDSAQGQNWCES